MCKLVLRRLKLLRRWDQWYAKGLCWHEAVVDRLTDWHNWHLKLLLWPSHSYLTKHVILWFYCWYHSLLSKSLSLLHLIFASLVGKTNVYNQIWQTFVNKLGSIPVVSDTFHGQKLYSLQSLFPQLIFYKNLASENFLHLICFFKKEKLFHFSELRKNLLNELLV